MVMKIHRLGRVSFRAVKEKRDYLGKRKSASWMYLSRLAAQKEWAFLKVLYEHQFPVPRPVDQARHCILMEFIDAYPLHQIDQVPSPGKLYSQLMDLIVRLAHAGLIHGDFNEFNILIRRSDGEPVVIECVIPQGRTDSCVSGISIGTSSAYERFSEDGLNTRAQYIRDSRVASVRVVRTIFG